MDTATLIPLPVFDAVAQTATEFLLQGKNVAIVGPPGAGTSSVASNVQQQLSVAKLPFALFDCAGGDIGPCLAAFTGPQREAGQNGIILIDHGASLPLADLQLVAKRIGEISAKAPTATLWLGSLDAHAASN